MNSSNILSIVTFVYALAAVLYITAWIFKKVLPGRIATWVTLFGVLGNVTGIGFRWFESYKLGFGHAPLSNMYESLVVFALIIAIICIRREI
jgi:ABC-type transport system involved in cytochrome c biogenesis permease subunit